jgi:hypothetical protein
MEDIFGTLDADINDGVSTSYQKYAPGSPRETGWGSDDDGGAGSGAGSEDDGGAGSGAGTDDPFSTCTGPIAFPDSTDASPVASMGNGLQVPTRTANTGASTNPSFPPPPLPPRSHTYYMLYELVYKFV